MSAEEPKTAVPAQETEAPVAASTAVDTKADAAEEAKASENAATVTEAKEEISKAADASPAAVPAVTATETGFSKFAARLPELVKAAEHSEMWGVQLKSDAPDTHTPTKVILQKFLRANNGDAAAAETQLSSALNWRKKLNPTALVSEVFDEKKYAGMGYVTTHKDDKGKETVITWNIYGAVKDNKKTFGDVEDFVKWRAALMEMGVQKLNLSAVTEPIPEGGEDPYQMIQVHDYLSVSFFKMDPHVKAASKETIQTLGMAYPELLSHKYFVNVPTIMGWMYAAMKLFLAPATLRKFHPMRSGTTLAGEVPAGVAESLPKEYGGKAESVEKIGESVKLAPMTGETKKEEISVEAPEAPVATVKEGDKPEEKAEDKPAEAKAEDKAEEPKVEEPKKDEA